MKTKKALKDHCRKLIKKWKNKSYIEGEDKEFLIRVFSKHPYWAQKTGETFFSLDIYIANSPSKWGGDCFWLLVNKTRHIDISFHKAISGINKNTEVAGALREEVRHQIWNYRKSLNLNYNNLICELTGESITKDNCHIDHYKPTFDELYKAWLKEENLSVSKVYEMVIENFSNEITMHKMLEDRELAERWKRYHKENALLRPLSIKGNLTRKS